MEVLDAPHLNSASRLPHNVEAERALLGALILDNRQIDAALGAIPSHVVHDSIQRSVGKRLRGAGVTTEPLFFSPAHQMIFAAIATLHHTLQSGIDLTTLGEELQRRGQLDAVGGAPYIAGLEDDIFSLDQTPQYVQIVVQKWQMRCLIRAAQSIAAEAAGSELTSAEVLERSEKRIFDIVQEQQQQDFVPIGEVIPEQLQEIIMRQKNGGELPGLATDFKSLDAMTTGLRPANMIILAARPSMGKTALAMNMASNIAVRQGKPVGIFSLEMSSEELSTRLLCTLAHVPMERVRGNAHLRRDEMEQLQEAADKLDRAPLHIDDASGLTILEMRSRARRLKSRIPNLSLLIIDYLQLMHSGASRVENRQQEVSEISRSIKSLARELEIPILALSQLSRQSEQRRGTKDKLPRLSDLRESGAIEQDADLVIFIHREKNMNAANEARQQEPDLATIRVAKQRNGRTGDLDMLFLGQFTEFVDVARG